MRFPGLFTPAPIEGTPVTLIAHRSLVGSYGRVTAGDTFQTDEETALSLEGRGLAGRLRPVEPVPVLRELDPVQFLPEPEPVSRKRKRAR